MSDSQFLHLLIMMIFFAFSCSIAGLIFWLGFQLIEFFIEKLRDWDYEKSCNKEKRKIKSE